MPNIKSSKKRVIVNNKKAAENKSIRSEVKTAIKKVEALIKDKKFDEAKVALSNAYKTIDSACAKNVLHANLIHQIIVFFFLSNPKRQSRKQTGAKIKNNTAKTTANKPQPKNV